MGIFNKNSKYFALYKIIIGKTFSLTEEQFFAIKKAAVKAKESSIWSKCYYDIMNKFGCWIGVYSSFENVPTFPHKLFGIFISNGAKIGKNCVIFHHVTIGSNNLGDSKNKGCPTIGDNVFIGTGAKIIGNVKIGDNCRIGANAVVVKDIPDNSVVVNQPGRIIYRETMNNHFETLDISMIKKDISNEN